KTPKRSLSRKSRTPTLSSPVNDTDLQQEIFWDPHSPIAHRLGSGRTKQSSRRCAVEISEIVNRIAPQDEKAACNEGSLLGTWIGEDAIPCTPGAVKVRARTKFTYLKMKNPEEELMKLAKEFDKNLVELDAVQEQEKFDHDVIQSNSESSAIKSKDEVNLKNLKSLLGEFSEADAALSLKPVGQSTGIPAAEPCLSSSPKSLDLEAEIALRALFDCSTQKCSGQLSQELSSISLNTSFHENKSTLEEDHLPGGIKGVRNGDAEASGKEAPCARGSVSKALPEPGPHSFTNTNPPPLKTQLVVSNKPAGVASDDLDDWDTDFLADDSFVMQITQNPELLSTEEAPPTAAAPSGPGFSNAARAKERKTTALPGKGDVKPDKLKPLWKSAQASDLISGPVSAQSKVNNGNVIIQPKSDPLPLLPSRSNPPRQWTEKQGSDTQSVPWQSAGVPADTKPTDGTGVVNQANPGHSHQAEMPKRCPLSFEDWNEPKFSEEVLDMFCEADSLWDANCEDDELLYQVCDDIEKQSQGQDVKQGNERAKTAQGASTNCRPNADSSLPASKQGAPDLLAQKVSLNPDAFSLNDSCRNSSKGPHGPAHPGNTPLTVISGASVEWKYTKSCHQAAAGHATKTVLGKWYRSNSVPAGEPGSEVSPVNAVNTSSNKTLDNPELLSDVGKMPSNSSGNKPSLMPSKFKFRRINSSQGVLHPGSANPGCPPGTGIPLQGLEGSRNQVNMALHSKPDKKPPFKRHLSESFALPTSVCVVEQKNRKCSQEEIERKKQEALARRKSRLQALCKDA
ncbi:ETAA1 protein, partial [Galbula dea]|nr:ETAA1 protein [Galbula dea]